MNSTKKGSNNLIKLVIGSRKEGAYTFRKCEEQHHREKLRLDYNIPWSIRSSL